MGRKPRLRASSATDVQQTGICGVLVDEEPQGVGNGPILAGMLPRRLHGDELERAIDKIEDANARDAVYEILMRARVAVNELKDRVSNLEDDVRKLRKDAR